MAASSYQQDLNLLGSPIQIFTDLAPSTVQKRCTLKPLLQQLLNCQIKYRWSFPFRISFTYRGKNNSFSNYHDEEGLLLEMEIITRDRSPPSPTKPVLCPPFGPLNGPGTTGRHRNQLKRTGLSLQQGDLLMPTGYLSPLPTMGTLSNSDKLSPLVEVTHSEGV